jgi:hypothetical protein
VARYVMNAWRRHFEWSIATVAIANEQVAVATLRPLLWRSHQLACCAVNAKSTRPWLRVEPLLDGDSAAFVALPCLPRVRQGQDYWE